jgi:plastocyanin
MMRALKASLALFLLLSGYADAGTVEAAVLSPGGRPVEDAAVVVEPRSKVNRRKNGITTIEQRSREFIPYVTIVQTGTAIDFPNHDPIKHHIYSFSAAKPFEIKLYAGKPVQPVVFDKPGEVVLGCNIHDWMEAYVLVVDSPHFAKTARDGRAVIPNVPAGRYRLQLWHPRQNARQPLRDIRVGAGAMKLNLVLDVKPRDIKPKPEIETDHY